MQVCGGVEIKASSFRPFGEFWKDVLDDRDSEAARQPVATRRCRP